MSIDIMVEAGDWPSEEHLASKRDHVVHRLAEGRHVMASGVAGHLAVLGAVAALLLGVAAAGFRGRDLRG